MNRRQELCRNFQRGSCKYGAQCKFAHASPQQPQQQQQQARPNPFGYGSTLQFAFAVWQSAPSAMVGFVPRMHWLADPRSNTKEYRYGSWWSVWWTGTYSMVLSKASFFHKQYLDLYTNQMLPSIHDYVKENRNCEDIAMSFLVANVTGAPPKWVQGRAICVDYKCSQTCPSAIAHGGAIFRLK